MKKLRKVMLFLIAALISITAIYDISATAATLNKNNTSENNTFLLEEDTTLLGPDKTKVNMRVFLSYNGTKSKFNSLNSAFVGEHRLVDTTGNYYLGNISTDYKLISDTNAYVTVTITFLSHNDANYKETKSMKLMYWPGFSRHNLGRA